jgi:hypothetical protein
MYKLLGKLPRKNRFTTANPSCGGLAADASRSSRGAILMSTSSSSACENAGYENKH